VGGNRAPWLKSEFVAQLEPAQEVTVFTPWAVRNTRIDGTGSEEHSGVCKSAF